MGFDFFCLALNSYNNVTWQNSLPKIALFKDEQIGSLCTGSKR